MVDFGYNNNAINIRNENYQKPVANGNIANSCMIALTDEPLSS